MNLKVSRIIKNWKFAPMVIPAKEGFVTNNVGSGRRFALVDQAPYREEAFAEFGLVPEAEEPMFGNFTGNHFLDGAFVHQHCDPAPEGYVHARCNLMIKKPVVGGMPVIDNQELTVEEGDLWLCLSSLEHHASTPIKGGERIIFSFGALVSQDQVVQKVLA